MDDQTSTLEDSARVLNPLWIISLFLGVAEVTVGIAATQADGWIQGLLAMFSVVFPSAVATVFFLIVWTRPYVLYAPRDYSDRPGISDFVGALSSTTDRSRQSVEASVRSAFEQVVVPKLTVLGDDQQHRSVVEEAVKTARRDFQQRMIEIDFGGIHSRLNGTYLTFPAADRATVADLLDTVYFVISYDVDTFSYGHSWVLQDCATRRDYTEIGTMWARRELGSEIDQRPLKEVGIDPGARLLAKRLDHT